VCTVVKAVCAKHTNEGGKAGLDPPSLPRQRHISDAGVSPRNHVYRSPGCVERISGAPGAGTPLALCAYCAHSAGCHLHYANRELSITHTPHAQCVPTARNATCGRSIGARCELVAARRVRGSMR